MNIKQQVEPKNRCRYMTGIVTAVGYAVCNAVHESQEAIMQTLDLRKQYKHLYAPSARQPVIVDVPSLQFALVEGAIEPAA